jgi:hypothetical protein
MPDELNLSDAYRKSRSNTSIVCGLGVAWSAAQFEFKKVSIGGLVEFDLSGASIAFLITICILYSFTRCAIEYVMQPKNVRRWRLAQFDFKLSLNLVRVSFLMLAVSGLNRSFSNAVFIATCIVFFISASSILEVIGTYILAPLFIFFRKRQEGFSVAPDVIDASSWSRLGIFVLTIMLIISLGFASLYYSPIRTFWPIPPNPITVLAAVVPTILVLTSVTFQNYFLNLIFARVEKSRSGEITFYGGKDGENPFSYSKL